jgi:NAD(P)-dependent dehydrogenase (short-subunit alcohol dehydrogenase family)
LSVVAVDLRDVGAVAEWCGRLRDAGRPLDILVNNAAQTIRRPAAAYAELAAGELVGGELVGGVVGGVVGDVRAAGVAAGPVVRALEASTGRDGAPVVGVSVPAARALATTGLLPDHSAQNSWTRRVHEVDPVELLEVQLVNVTAPFLLVGQLRPVLAEGARRASSGRAYVVNVSAVEGQFDRRYKAPGHPHTNMAKAALNMLTRTSAEDLAAEGVLMTSVDTGWITDEKPHPQKERMAAAGFRTPLDVVDGAARIYDPIVRGEGPDGGEAVYGCFLKDYRSAAW